MPKQTNETKAVAAKPARKPAVRKRTLAAAPPVSHDDIAERAYALYLEGIEGGPFEHWVRAERELTAA